MGGRERLIEVIRTAFSKPPRISGAFPAADAFAAVIEALPGPAWLVDSHDRIVASNTAGRRLLRRHTRLPRSFARQCAKWPVHSSTLPVHYLLIGASGLLVEQHATEWKLTRREREVLALVVRGESNEHIANELCIAKRTVEVHVSAILKKAKLQSRAEVIASVYGLRRLWENT